MVFLWFLGMFNFFSGIANAVFAIHSASWFNGGVCIFNMATALFTFAVLNNVYNSLNPTI